MIMETDLLLRFYLKVLSGAIEMRSKMRMLFYHRQATGSNWGRHG
jgi:hypothetical protein